MLESFFMDGYYSAHDISSDMRSSACFGSMA